MTDPPQGSAAAGAAAAVPKPSAIRPRPLAVQQATAIRPQVLPASASVLAQDAPAPGMAREQPALPAPRADSRRASARDALDAVLTGVRLSCRDRQFLGRLVHWDKRNAASVAALIWRARLTGRDEATLTPRQLEIVMAALRDAAVYRASGADVIGCWDCANIPGGRCADHVRDPDRARAYADLATLLAGRAADPGCQQPTEISGYLRRTPVAS